MRKKLLFLLLTINTIGGISAQTYDEKISDAMNRGDWFSLDSLRRIAPKDSIMPFLEVFSRCLIGNRLNRPDISVPAFDELFKSHTNYLGLDNLLSSTVMFATDLGRIGYNKQASELMQAILASTRQYLDSTWTEALEQGISRHSSLAEYKPYGITFSERTGRIPFEIVPVGEEKYGSVLMHLENSLINGHESDITFDTGAGVNMICDSLSTAYNLIPIDGFITVAGIGKRKGQIAIAKELKIGNITVTDVPFVITDFKTGNAKADKFTDKFNIVLGSDLMLRLKDLTIDFTANEITIPADAPARTNELPNMCFGDGMGLNVKGSVLGKPLLMNIDTGDAAYGSLGVAFYNANKEYVVNESRLDTIRRGGLGGVVESLCYRVQRMPINMGGHTVNVPDLVVYTQEIPAAMDFNCNIGLKTLMMFGKVRFNLTDFVFTTYPQNQISTNNHSYTTPSFKRVFTTKDKGVSWLQAMGIVAIGVARCVMNQNTPYKP